eukprot:146849-Prymnesium_polylepis.1
MRCTAALGKHATSSQSRWWIVGAEVLQRGLHTCTKSGVGAGLAEMRLRLRAIEAHHLCHDIFEIDVALCMAVKAVKQVLALAAASEHGIKGEWQ